MAKLFREKSQIVVLSTFDQREFKKNKIFWNKCVQCAKKGKKYPFSHTVRICFKIFFFFLIHVDQKYSKQQFEIFP